jgi:hypothetical protein
MATRIPLSDRELLDYSREHVIYELWMFRSVAQALTSPVQISQALRNALIESSAIHLRNLIDFLYPGQIQADDVVAAEFFDNPSEWETVSMISAKLSSARIWAHQEVSHLTRKRIWERRPRKAGL